MTSTRRRELSRPSPASTREIGELRTRLAEEEETLRAIRSGAVDAVVVANGRGARVFTLEGAERAYRLLIESMNEGALTLSADGTILYANGCFAELVKRPLEKVIGSAFRRFLPAGDRALFEPLVRRAARSGSKIQVLLQADDGSRVPAQLSTRSMRKDGVGPATVGVVVTDLTEARRNEEMLRAFSRRLVQAQEAERRRVAADLHDHVTQHLCAALFRCRALAERLPERDAREKDEAFVLCGMIGRAAEEVERITRNLRPGVLNELGLPAVVRATAAEFVTRTNVRLDLSCARWATRLPPAIEMTIYRILQESLRNVEEHARASHVTVILRRRGACVRLVVSDDGVGFDPDRRLPQRKGKDRLGLLGMRERAQHVGGTLEVTSARRAGTDIEVRIPVPPGAPVAGSTSRAERRRGHSGKG
jgi:two-component system, NarL family, sensor kinase